MTTSIQAKREPILAAAMRVFAEHGFPDSDVQEIADAAKVGKGTVYRHFGNKRELFQAVANDAMSRLEGFVLDRVGGAKDCPADQIRVAGLAYAEFFQQNPYLVEIMIQERAEFRGSIPDTHLFYREKNRGQFEAILRQGKARGTFRQLNVKETTNAFANLLYGTVVCGCLEGMDTRLGEMAEHAIDLFLRAICNDVRK